MSAPMLRGLRFDQLSGTAARFDTNTGMLTLHPDIARDDLVVVLGDVARLIAGDRAEYARPVRHLRAVDEGKRAPAPTPEPAPEPAQQGRVLAFARPAPGGGS